MITLEEQILLCDNLKECADSLVTANIYRLLPEIGTNIGYTINGTAVEDVCDIPGRIRRVENDCCYVRNPKMGGSVYMAGTLLTIRKKFPEAQCVANFRNNEKILASCKSIGFRIVHMPTIPDFWQLGDDYDRDLERTIADMGELADVITIPDRINLEKLILVVGKDIADFREKVLKISQSL